MAFKEFVTALDEFMMPSGYHYQYLCSRCGTGFKGTSSFVYNVFRARSGIYYHIQCPIRMRRSE